MRIGTVWLRVACIAITCGMATLIAVSYGEPDDGRHPYVGLVVFYDQVGNPMWRCTGSLISKKVLVTAAHCTETPAKTAQVWFDEKVDTQSGGYSYSGGIPGVPYPHPGWTGALTLPNTHDIGVVVLNQEANSSKYAVLPTEGQLDGLATRRGLKDVSFTVVGYGLQGMKPQYLGERERRMGTARLVNLGSALTDGYNIQLSNNPGHWSGGTCFGDSGGPTLLANTDILVAVTSFGLNANCKGVGFAYRVDIADSLDFVSGYLSPSSTKHGQ